MSRFQMQADGMLQPLSFDGGAGNQPLLQSESCPDWAGFPFELHRTRPFSHERDSGPPDGQQTLIVLVEGATELTIRGRNGDVTHRSGPGSISYHTAEERPRVVRVAGSGKIVAIRLTPAWRNRVHPDGEAVPSFQPPMAADDTMCLLATTLCREVRQGGTSGSLFAGSLCLSLLSYAFDRLPTGPSTVRGALSAAQRRRVRRYIDDRLQTNLTVEELAALCHLGCRQFSSLFRRAFGCSPYRYVLEQRVERSTELLREGGLDLEEIAGLVGFSSASHFSSAFRRVHGQPPRRYVRELRTTVDLTASERRR